MKKLFGILLAAGLSAGAVNITFAQTTPPGEAEEVKAQPERSSSQQGKEENLLKTRSTRQDKRHEKQLDEIRDLAKARSNPESEFKKPEQYRSNTEGFTVTKYKESKTKKKLRRGQGSTRLSVPDPKGKPLKHKKKSKFRLFGN